MLVSRCFLHEMISYIFSILWDLVPDKKKGSPKKSAFLRTPFDFLSVLPASVLP